MMTAEKLDEADALQGQYGKSESINQFPIFIPSSLVKAHYTSSGSELRRAPFAIDARRDIGS